MRYPIAFLLLAVAITVAGCGCGKSSHTTTQTGGPVTISVTVKGGKPVGGIHRATAKKGDTIVLVVNSDVADEVHFHGYDLHEDVTAGGTIRMRFKANIVGVFEAELESRKL